ncbi:uncharacterized protein LOC114315831 [Camellia sinensis]|uniref:uncharacterized protein LOC114315831 n=1 Tax=Camellia sinensis TaxID=4442 RepID=UPI001035DCFE|nr:uncharacterized protein LOC114315831 [Camellia sinensis]
MNNLTKAIFNGDFDESSSSDDDIIMMQLQLRRSLFVSILHDIQQVNECFIQTHDAIGAPGLFGVQKITVALQILQYDVPADAVNEGRAAAANYTINNHAYTMRYYLTDGIYPRWATIVKTISQPQGTKRQLFVRMQEACRKDVERAFGVLHARFNIIKVPARGWSDDDLYYIMKTCIILHNMIIEDERNIPENERSAAQLKTDTNNTLCQVSCDPNEEYAQFMLNRQRIRFTEAHNAICNDLIQRLWSRAGELN